MLPVEEGKSQEPEEPRGSSGPPTQPPAKEGVLWQPLPAWAYMVIAGICLAITIALLVVFVQKAPTLVAQGISNKFFFVLLVPLGLATAAFVFGGMRAYATISGKQNDTKWEVAGPAAGTLLVVVAGFLLVPDNPPFSITARFRDTDGRLLTNGSATIYPGQKGDKQPITSAGDATYKEIADDFRGTRTRIDLEAPGYLLADPKKDYSLTPGVIAVDVKIDPTYVEPETESLVQSVVGVPDSTKALTHVIKALKSLKTKTLSEAQRSALLEEFQSNNKAIQALLDTTPPNMEAQLDTLVPVARELQKLLGDQDFWKQTRSRIHFEVPGYEI